MVLVAVPYEGEGIGDAQVRVLAHADDEEHLVTARMAVEVVAVVEVAIARRHVGDPSENWWIGVVVERRQRRRYPHDAEGTATPNPDGCGRPSMPASIWVTVLLRSKSLSGGMSPSSITSCPATRIITTAKGESPV